MRSRMHSFLLLLALAGLAAGCGKKDSPSQPPTGGGGTAESFNSGAFSSASPVKVFVHTFAAAGSYGYRCTIHAGMTGTVTCVDGAAESTFVSITDNAFTPSTVQVRPGGYVKWTANGGTHTVTRP